MRVFRYGQIIHISAIVNSNPLFQVHKIQVAFDSNKKQVHHINITLKHKTTHKLHHKTYQGNSYYGKEESKMSKEALLFVINFLASENIKRYNVSNYNSIGYEYIEITLKSTIASAIRKLSNLQVDEDEEAFVVKLQTW